MELELKQKTSHMIRKHPQFLDDDNKYKLYASECGKIYADVIYKISQLENLEFNIKQLNPKKNIQNKKWYIDYSKNRTSFFQTINNITKK